MKKFVSAFCIPIILLGLSCTRDFSLLQPPSRERDLQHVEKELLNASSDFGIGLFKEVAKAEAGENVLISPFSVSAALGMTLNGAAGQTEADMRKTLGFPGWTQESINEAYRSLINALTQADPKVAMDIAQAIYYALGFAVEPSFIQTNLDYFDALVSKLDFALPSAPDTINGWIEKNTGGKIKNMIKKIEREDVMFLINAIYFKGTWTIQFDEKETRNETFTRGDGSRIICPMMRMCDSLSYLSTADFQAVDLAYGDGAFSMVVFLPKNGQTVDAFIQGITSEKWNDWMSRLGETKVNLIFPKFKAEYDVLLNDALIAMGMGVAFSGGADFTRINPRGGLFISRVLHKAFVEVDEEGTEAAAATVVVVSRSSSGGTDEIFMFVNHPFVFAIRERQTGAILFMGKIEDPS